MLNSIVISRYSKAIFEIAIDKSKVEEFAQELDSVAKLLSGDDNIVTFFEMPFISQKDKNEVIESTFKGMRKEIIKFVEVLIRYKKIRLISDIYEAFNELVHKSENKVPGKLTTAKKISDKQVKIIEAKISKLLNKSVVLKQVEEKEMLGGFKVEVGSYIVDTTIKAQLDKFRNHSV